MTATALHTQVFLTNPTAIEIKAVEAKPGAEGALKIVGRLLQTRATLLVAAVMAKIRIVAPPRARCYIVHRLVPFYPALKRRVVSRAPVPTGLFHFGV